MNAEQKKVVEDLKRQIDEKIAPPVFDSLAAASALAEIQQFIEASLDGTQSAVDAD